jgi:S1-C subfamily serine protease
MRRASAHALRGAMLRSHRRRAAKRATGLLVLATVAALFAFTATVAATPDEVFRIASRSVVVIQALDRGGALLATGSGVVIAPDRVATNCHVVRSPLLPASRVLLVGGAMSFRAATLERSDPAADVCILHARRLARPAAATRAASALRVGESVYAIGAPQGLELSLSGGLVSSLRRIQGELYVQTDAAISKGSSGGGLFDADARLVGITTFTVKDGQNLNFAIPVERVLQVARLPEGRPGASSTGNAASARQ